MVSNVLEKVFGSDEAKHLLFGNSLLKNWKGKGQDGSLFGNGLEYAVFVRSGASLHDLLKDVETTLASLHEEDKAGRTCIVQVLI